MALNAGTGGPGIPTTFIGPGQSFNDVQGNSYRLDTEGNAFWTPSGGSEQSIGSISDIGFNSFAMAYYNNTTVYIQDIRDSTWHIFNPVGPSVGGPVAAPPATGPPSGGSTPGIATIFINGGQSFTTVTGDSYRLDTELNAFWTPAGGAEVSLGNFSDIGHNALQMAYYNQTTVYISDARDSTWHIFDPNTQTYSGPVAAPPANGPSSGGTLPATGCNTFAQIDACVANAKAAGLKVILSHQGNELPASPASPCWSVQANGLPYDSGGSSGNDDGCGNGSNVTLVQWENNTVALMQRYTIEPTVIAYQIHHRPLVTGSFTGQAKPGGGVNPGICWNCGSGDTDWMCIAQELGNLVFAVNPNIIMIVPGPVNRTSTLLNGQPLNSGAGLMDLTGVAQSPVGGVTNGPPANKVAYSVDLYPSNVWGVTPDNGASAISAWNTFFGYLEIAGTAPVFISEVGCSCDGSNGNLPNDSNFMATFVSYANGVASGGPAFPGRNQPMSTNWFVWGNRPGSNPNGTLNADNSVKSGQWSWWQQLLFTPRVATPGRPMLIFGLNTTRGIPWQNSLR
jgi:hypothetical protein